MKKIVMFMIVFSLMCSGAFAFYLHIGQSQSEVFSAIGQPNYTEEYVDSDGKVTRCQWGSERVGTMVVIEFKNGKVLRFSTKGKGR